MLLLLPGLCIPDCDDIDARLLGRLPLGSREAGTPNDSRLTPDSPGPVMEEVVDADGRFLALLTVTVLGM